MTEGEKSNKMVSIEDAEEQVVIAAKRLALLYHYAAEVIVERYGEEEGREVLHEIIKRYGTESGLKARERVKESGFSLTADNFNQGSDLPKWGWDADQVACDDGIERIRIKYCPLAEVWKERGSEELGRIYCYVDQAKYEAYNGIKCRHLKNVLDGDDCCLFDFVED